MIYLSVQEKISQEYFFIILNDKTFHETFLKIQQSNTEFLGTIKKCFTNYKDSCPYKDIDIESISSIFQITEELFLEEINNQFSHSFIKQFNLFKNNSSTFPQGWITITGEDAEDSFNFLHITSLESNLNSTAKSLVNA